MEATGKQKQRPKRLQAVNRIRAYLVKWHGLEGEVDCTRAGISPGKWPAFVTVGKSVYYFKLIDRDGQNRVVGALYARRDDDGRSLELLNS